MLSYNLFHYKKGYKKSNGLWILRIPTLTKSFTHSSQCVVFQFQAGTKYKLIETCDFLDVKFYTSHRPRYCDKYDGRKIEGGNNARAVKGISLLTRNLTEPLALHPPTRADFLQKVSIGNSLFFRYPVPSTPIKEIQVSTRVDRVCADDTSSRLNWNC